MVAALHCAWSEFKLFTLNTCSWLGTADKRLQSSTIVIDCHEAHANLKFEPIFDIQLILQFIRLNFGIHYILKFNLRFVISYQFN